MSECREKTNKKIALLSIPFDENSSFCKGPAKAPKAIISALTGGSLNRGTENNQLLKWGENIIEKDLLSPTTPENFFTNIVDSISTLLKQKFRIISLGGDHSITYPIVHAYAQNFQDINIVHLDAHSDLYHEFKGNPFSNASPFARIMENKLAKSLHQYGIRTLTQHQIAQANKFRVNVNEMKDWPSSLPKLKGPIYLSIDIDAIDPAFAPGVSHREPGGLNSREVINLIHQLPKNVIGIDIVEYNPDKDIDDLTANLAAKLVKESAGIMLASFEPFPK